jgi:polyisoprenoid-binding protein YceI
MTQTVDTTAIAGYRTGAWQIDPSHSEVAFSVRHMMVSKMRGRFTDFSGTINAAEELAESSVEVSVQLTSIETGSEQRDAHLRSPDFFHTDESPVMTYRASGVVRDGDAYRLEGELTLKGITRTVPVSFEVTGLGPDAFGGVRAGFSGEAEINRQDFNVTWNQAIEGVGVVVGDKVKIHLEIQAVYAG